MNVKLTWTPGSGATTQTIEYRVVGASSWTVLTTTLSISVSSYVVTGLASDTSYQFRVITNCTGNPNIAITLSGNCPAPVIQSYTLSMPSID